MKSYSKIRHIQESNIKLEKMYLNESSDSIKIPKQFRGVIMDFGDRASAQDIINAYNSDVEEGTTLVYYQNNHFYNENGDGVPVNVVLDELNYAIVGDEDEMEYNEPKDVMKSEDDMDTIYLTKRHKIFVHSPGDVMFNWADSVGGGGGWKRIPKSQLRAIIDLLSRHI